MKKVESFLLNLPVLGKIALAILAIALPLALAYYGPDNSVSVRWTQGSYSRETVDIRGDGTPDVTYIDNLSTGTRIKITPTNHDKLYFASMISN